MNLKPAKLFFCSITTLCSRRSETVLKHLQDCRNIQSTLATLEKKTKDTSARNFFEALHNELSVKKLHLKETLSSIAERKDSLCEQSSGFDNTHQLLNDHKRVTFGEVWSRVSNEIEGSQCGREMQLTLLTLAQKKRENYQAYFDLKSTIVTQQIESEGHSRAIEQQKQHLAALHFENCGFRKRAQ